MTSWRGGAVVAGHLGPASVRRVFKVSAKRKAQDLLSGAERQLRAARDVDGRTARTLRRLAAAHTTQAITILIEAKAGLATSPLTYP
jgi:hypothetical protein